jgi:hypothetical protein
MVGRKKVGSVLSSDCSQVLHSNQEKSEMNVYVMWQCKRKKEKEKSRTETKWGTENKACIRWLRKEICGIGAEIKISVRGRI